jgi:formylglycine-generating enzyme required for sulfatase activity
MPLHTSQILKDRYRVVRPIGQGGFGTVYRAWDINLNIPCALKENLDTSEDAQRQFQREASLLATLRHPNLPRVTDHFFISGQGQYLVMDFIEGQSLAQLLEQQASPVNEAQALAWIEQVCHALDYLHNRTPPIIHRDIKPQNIIVTSAGQAMLVDFGISKLFDPLLRTSRGARGATPGFSPPEQYGQGNTDARSDIYALGATLYTLLTGQVPPDAIDRLVQQSPLPAPTDLNPRISSTAEHAIIQAIELTPTGRFASIQAFRQALSGGSFTSAPKSFSKPTPKVTKWEPIMVVIPAGSFLMGSKESDEHESHELPQRQVQLSPYSIGKYPVTNTQYAAFVQSAGHRPPSRWYRSLIPRNKEENPVVHVSWEDAFAYCRWLAEITQKHYRLPTEAEWEKAARGGDGRIYPWGNNWLPQQCNSYESFRGDSSAVGLYSPAGDSPYGCADMVGNVWEWVSDWYGSYSDTEVIDPSGPATGTFKVLRGGNWYTKSVRTTCRLKLGPRTRLTGIGFRCACSL